MGGCCINEKWKFILELIVDSTHYFPALSPLHAPPLPPSLTPTHHPRSQVKSSQFLFKLTQNNYN